MRPVRRTARAWLAALAAALWLGGCAAWSPFRSGMAPPVGWSALRGWEADRHAQAWPALLRSCDKLADRAPAWRRLCRAAAAEGEIDDARARAFFERWFRPRPLRGRWFRRTGLITGYYEPLLRGSLSPDPRYPYPLYRPPPDLVTVELGELFPALQGRRVRGRLAGRRVVPYYSRAEIDGGGRPLAGHELVWVDDPVAAFFLHIQGSGRIRLEDGRVLGIGYADQNGHPYRAIGRTLVEMGALALEEVNLFSLRDWLRAHPRRAAEVLHSNPSYVFFRLRPAPAAGPIGSLGVPLTAGRSLAVDPRVVPLGLPVWLDSRRPEDGRPYRRLMLAQDTGGAIRGTLRADVFFGHGPEAERLAGHMKQPGRLYVLEPVAP